MPKKNQIVDIQIDFHCIRCGKIHNWLTAEILYFNTCEYHPLCSECYSELRQTLYPHNAGEIKRK